MFLADAVRRVSNGDCQSACKRDSGRNILKLLELLHFNYSAINPVAIQPLMPACGLPSDRCAAPFANSTPKRTVRD
jgi:hypothetical protein